MARWLRRRAAALSALPAMLLAATAAAGSPTLHNAFVAGVAADLSPGVGAQVELLIKERLRLQWVGPAATRWSLLVDGRAALRLVGAVRPDRVRVRALGVHADAERWSLDVGRFAVDGGGWRLVDGVQAFARPLPDLAIGGWFGAVPDPGSTAPGPRIGGGPSVVFTPRWGRFSAVGEVVGAAAGLDRAGVVLDAVVEPDKRLELAGHVDLQAAPGGAPLPAELAAGAAARPVDGLRVGGGWDAYSGLAWLQTPLRDPAVQRFAARAWALDPDQGDIPPDQADTTLHHAFHADLLADPALGAARLRLAARFRGRVHAQPSRRYAIGRAEAGATGLAHGRVDAWLEQAVLQWGGLPRAETAVVARLTPDKGRWLQLDGSLRVAFAKAEAPSVRTSLYADLFADLVTPSGVTVGLAYRFQSDQLAVGWDPAHAILAQIGWIVRRSAR